MRLDWIGCYFVPRLAPVSWGFTSRSEENGSHDEDSLLVASPCPPRFAAGEQCTPNGSPGFYYPGFGVFRRRFLMDRSGQPSSGGPLLIARFIASFQSPSSARRSGDGPAGFLGFFLSATRKAPILGYGFANAPGGSRTRTTGQGLPDSRSGASTSSATGAAPGAVYCGPGVVLWAYAGSSFLFSRA